MGINQRVSLRKFVDDVKRWVDEGRSDDWIASALGTSSSSVQSFRSRNGIYRKNPGAALDEPIDYEAYEGMAEQVMAELAEKLKARHELCKVAIHHRVGRVEVGDTSVVIAVSAPHRAAALAACAEAIDELKVSVPLWKKETYVGGEEWIGQGS